MDHDHHVKFWYKAVALSNLGLECTCIVKLNWSIVIVIFAITMIIRFTIIVKGNFQYRLTLIEAWYSSTYAIGPQIYKDSCLRTLHYRSIDVYQIENIIHIISVSLG